MSDDVQEGQAFAAAVFGRGPTKPPAEEVPPQPPEPEPDEPTEDPLMAALREHDKGWQRAFVEMLHPPPKEQEK